MKILLAFPRPLVPADTGGKIRSFQIFSRLAKRAEIHAISLANKEDNAEGIEEMRRIFASYTPVYWTEAARPSLRFYFELLANQLSPLPYSVAKYCLPLFIRTGRSLAASHRFDLLFCDFLTTSTPLLSLPLRPRVVFQHNVESILRKRQWEAETVPLKKWVFAAEWKKTHKIEARVCRSFDYVIAVSEEDRRLFERNYGVRNVSTIPTGVDTEYFQPVGCPQQPGRLVFVGSMDWYPNEDGVTWFLREVYPRIQKEVPHVSLTIVGRNPSRALTAAVAPHSGVTLTGRVPDVRSFLAESEVVVVPLRVGGGTRIKIPEAMAMAKPVVSTSIGAEGLPFADGREICRADEPEEFSRAVVELLKDGARRTAMGQAARERLVREHSWDLVVDRLEQILKTVARHARETTRAECPVPA